MPTPAIDINTIVTGVSERTTRSVPSGSESHGTFPVRTSFYMEKRPASSSVPFVGDRHFRPCRAWSHEGWRHQRDSDTVVSRSWNTTSRQGTDYVVTNGGAWDLSVPSMPAFSGNLENAALVCALEKLKSQNIHVGNFLAEFHKTVQLVGNTAATISRQVREYKTLNPRLWKRIKRYQNGHCLRRDFNKIPAGWLSIQYGWNPLLTDVLGAIAELQRASRGGLPINVRCKKERRYARITDVSSFDGWKAYQWEDIREFCAVSLWYVLKNPSLAELSSLGLVNPAEIVWETLRYSFVVDWFLPIGPWLSSLTADFGYDFVTGSVSHKLSRTFRYSDLTEPVAPKNIVFGGMTLPTLSGESQKFRRDCYASSPVPGVYFKNPLSAKHALNGLALLSQAFR